MSSAMNRGVSRRSLLKFAAAGAAGASGWFDVLANRAAGAEATGNKPKSCILLWLDGGPSQAHTFDPKASAGKVALPGAIRTSVPGIQVSEFVPQLAAQMKDLVLLRSMSSGDANHPTAKHLMRTGFRVGPGEVRPHVGAMAAEQAQAKRQQLKIAEPPLPGFVVLKTGSGGQNGIVSGFLGPSYAPLILNRNDNGIPYLSPAGDQATVDRRALTLEKINQEFNKQYQAEAIAAHIVGQQKALAAMHSDKALKAFNVELETPKMREAYGIGGAASSRVGQACLTARRLLEAGVSFVEVVGSSWDTHSSQGVAALKPKTLSELDAPLAVLIGDLKERGLLDSTLVIGMGEFGRTVDGTGHWPRAWTAVLAGAGLKSGQVIGRTDARAMTVEERPIRVADFMATVLKALDIDHARGYRVDGRPVGMVDKDPEPVKELFA